MLNLVQFLLFCFAIIFFKFLKVCNHLRSNRIQIWLFCWIRPISKSFTLLSSSRLPYLCCLWSHRRISSIFVISSLILIFNEKVCLWCCSLVITRLRSNSFWLGTWWSFILDSVKSFCTSWLWELVFTHLTGFWYFWLMFLRILLLGFFNLKLTTTSRSNNYIHRTIIFLIVFNLIFHFLCSFLSFFSICILNCLCKCSSWFWRSKIL